MKKTQITLGALFLAVVTGFSQGTFLVTLDSSHAVPPNESLRRANGLFTLDSSRIFSGQIIVEDGFGTSVSLFRSTNPAELGTRLFDLLPGAIIIGNPDGGGQYFYLDDGFTLTQPEVSDLQSGFWWLAVVTDQAPDGEIRGQITAVPEPNSIALVSFITVLAILLRHSKVKRCVRATCARGC
jgi:hypothetical protein